MRYHARKKASKQYVAKKPKLTRSQEEQKKAKSARDQYIMNTPAKAMHIENNRTVIPYLVNKNTDL